MRSVLPLHQRLKVIPQTGVVRWVGVSPAHGEPMQTLTQVTALTEQGIEGDVAALACRPGKRQVTLMQAEHLPVLAGLLGVEVVVAEQLRRNLVISGINLLALVKLHFAVGAEVVLVGTGPCAPCGRMDETLGPGGFQAVRGHGGITARVERGGVIRPGDIVQVLADEVGSSGVFRES